MVTASERLLQTMIDGESTAAEAAAAERILDADPALREQHKLLSELDLTARRRAALVTAQHTDHDQLVAAVMARLPAEEPSRRLHVEFGTALATLLISTVAAAGYGVAGTMDDLLPLTWMAIASVVVGLVVMIGLGRYRHDRQGDSGLSVSGRLRAPTPPGRS